MKLTLEQMEEELETLLAHLRKEKAELEKDECFWEVCVIDGTRRNNEQMRLVATVYDKRFFQGDLEVVAADMDRWPLWRGFSVREVPLVRNRVKS